MPSPIRTEAILHSPPTHLSSSSPPSPYSKWAPYSNFKDFDAKMTISLVVLVCATILAFLLHAAARCLFRRYRRGPRHADHRETPADGKAKSGREATSLAETALVYTAGTRLAGAEAECAICLAEFAEGEIVRVLPACNHGFHLKCIQCVPDGGKGRDGAEKGRGMERVKWATYVAFSGGVRGLVEAEAGRGREAVLRRGTAWSVSSGPRTPRIRTREREREGFSGDPEARVAWPLWTAARARLRGTREGPCLLPPK